MNQSLKNYTQHLEPKTVEKLRAFSEEIQEWNGKINLISRKDIDFLVERHIAPCLAFNQIIKFAPNSKILDVGTGGGFPGLVLAICHPKAQFTLVDSIGKKIKVVQNIANKLNLKNVNASQKRVETLRGKFDFVVGRAVTNLPDFISWTYNKLKKGNSHNLENGLLYQKGGPLEPQLEQAGLRPTKLFELSNFYKGEFYEEKYIAHFKAEDIEKCAPKLLKIIEETR